jgi:hypothetical protein
MVDQGAFPFVPGDITGLFRRLNGAPMYDILDTLDALLKKKNFYPNFNTYRAELDSAGTFVQRMEVAMSAVLAKNASQQTATTWEKFQEVQDFKLRLLPVDQQRNIKDYWAAGPTPGLQAGTAPVSSSIANVSWDKYVDQFTECIYDVNYKVVNYFSTILQLKYSDGLPLELDLEKDFSELKLSPAAARDSMASGYIGRGGRIFPRMVMFRTTPRLWAARIEAFRIQDEAFKDFANLAVTGVSFALMVPAMPAGAMEEAAIASTRVTRRSVPASTRGAGMATAESNAINGIRAANPEFASLTNEEMLAIRAYTGEDWATINASLRGATGPSNATNTLTRNMISGLNKLPGFTGRVVRSEALPIEEAVAEYAQGKTFTAQGMLSTSRAGAVAQREGNVAITIQAVGKQGKDISKLSVHAGKESEVLFPPGSRFTVQQSTRIGDGLIVVLQEL